MTSNFAISSSSSEAKTAEAAREQWASVADTLRERCPKLTELMDRSREEVLVYMSFPREQSTLNPLLWICISSKSASACGLLRPVSWVSAIG